MATKKEWRTRLRAERKQLAETQAGRMPEVAAELSTTVRAWLAEHAPEARCVTSYESEPGEPPTDRLNADLRAAGVTVLVPITLPDLDLDWCALRPDGTRSEALGLEAVRDADVILTPGLAVDPHGYRLGQGGGCYDRVLARVADLRPGLPVMTVLWAPEQVTEDLPHRDHDRQVDGVLAASPPAAPA